MFGGPFDDAFAEPSKRFFDQVRDGRFVLVTSVIVEAELAEAPKSVRDLWDEMLAVAEVAEVSEDALALRQAYLKEGILGEKSANDALHVALASVARCELIVSWNFRHIVHFDKIRLYNAMNVLQGYPEVGIFAPTEVVHYEEDV